MISSSARSNDVTVVAERTCCTVVRILRTQCRNDCMVAGDIKEEPMLPESDDEADVS